MEVLNKLKPSKQEEKEVKNKTVALRTLDGQVKFGVKPDVLLGRILENINNKELKFKI